MMRWMAALAALLIPTAAQVQSAPYPGETYEIVRVRESASQSNDGSTGSTYDRDTIRERVIAVRGDGLELEYDFPRGTKAKDRARDWSLPARVFRRAHGPLILLNALGPAPLRKTGTSYTAELMVDPEQVRRGNAETDMVVAGSAARR